MLLAATAFAGHVLLVGSVLRRALTREPLALVLSAHAVLPPWARGRFVGNSVEVVQCAIGAVGAVTMAVPGPHAPIARAASAAAGFLYAGFALYLAVLMRRRRDVACGCFGGAERVGWPAVLRAAVLAVSGVAWGGMADLFPGGDILARIALVPMGLVIGAAMVFVVGVLSEAQPGAGLTTGSS